MDMFVRTVRRHPVDAVQGIPTPLNGLFERAAIEVVTCDGDLHA